MEQMANLKKNYLYRTAYDILSIITPIITAPYISRVIGADGVGIYSYTTSIMTYFTMMASLGTSSYGIRECARNRNSIDDLSSTFWEIELLSVVTTLLSSVMWFVLCIFERGKYGGAFFALFPVLIGIAFDISWLFTGIERVREIVLRNSLVKISSIALLFCLVKTKDDLLLYILINSVSQLLGNLSMWIYLPSIVNRVRINNLHVTRHFKQTLIYFIPTIATSVYTVLDKTLIGLITKDNYANGYYEQSTKIINIAKTVVFTSVNSVMGARMSFLFKERKYDEIHDKIEKSFDFIMFLGVGSTFGIASIAERFVPVFFGNGYLPTVFLLRLMAPLIIIIGISNCLGCQYYTPIGKRTESAKYIITGAVVNLCMNIILIPNYGAVGAVMGSLIAETVITILYLWKCDGYLSIKIFYRSVYKKFLAAIVMSILIFIIDRYFVCNDVVLLIIECLLGAAFYYFFLLVWRDGSAVYLFEVIRKRYCFGKKK